MILDVILCDLERASSAKRGENDICFESIKNTVARDEICSVQRDRFAFATRERVYS